MGRHATLCHGGCRFRVARSFERVPKLLIYRLALVLITPFVVLRLVWALIRGRETFHSLAERLSLGAGPSTTAPHVWVHGASLGELTGARHLIERILSANSRLRILITCNNAAARDMVENWQNPRVDVRIAPLDAPLIVAHFLRRWHPIALITLENEIWPARIVFSAREGLPVMVVGGRMSKRSAATWARFGSLAAQVMGAISCLAPADPENGARFVGLGLSPARLCDPINLKASVKLALPDPKKLAELAPFFNRADTILAASTHPGEDAMILQAFQKASARRPRLRLILAPRHPGRADDIARQIKEAGLRCSRRSQGGLPARDDSVYLADTNGEMAIFHSLAGVTVVAGSFSGNGGHSPVEAVQFGSVVVHGPDVSNHHETYRALDDANASYRATTASELADILVCLEDAKICAQMSERAKTALAQLRPSDADTDQILARLAPLLRHHTIR